MLTIIGKLMNAWDAAFGETDMDRMVKRMKVLTSEGSSVEEAKARAMAEYKNGFLARPHSMGDDAIELADKLSAAAKSWRAVDMSSISESMISSWTETATTYIKDLFGPSPKPPKRPTVHVQNQWVTVDLRGEDPDRSFSAFLKPLENLAKYPTSAATDTVGGMG
jgi:hypothetical protein